MSFCGSTWDGRKQDAFAETRRGAGETSNRAKGMLLDGVAVFGPLAFARSHGCQLASLPLIANQAWLYVEGTGAVATFEKPLSALLLFTAVTT